VSDAATRAAAAKRLLDDPLLVEVLDAIEDAAVKVWRSTSEADSAARERAYYTVKASERVRNTLQGIVDNGLIEASRASRER
jgi:hypothetical protein